MTIKDNIARLVKNKKKLLKQEKTSNFPENSEDKREYFYFI